MISPENVPENAGFSPKPARPKKSLIATYPVEGANCIGRGLDRDRVVDETGAQTVVFGRRGSRPFNLDEMLPFLRHGDVDGDGKDGHRTGPWYRVEDVVVEKDKAGKQTLLTKSGGSLSAPVAFVDPTGTPAPVAMPGATSTSPAMYPNGVPVPPGGYAPLPEQEPGHEFMNAPDVQRLLRTLDPTRPPDQPAGTVPVPPPPSISPTPAAGSSANPFLQEDAAGPAPAPQTTTRAARCHRNARACRAIASGPGHPTVRQPFPPAERRRPFITFQTAPRRLADPDRRAALASSVCGAGASLAADDAPKRGRRCARPTNRWHDLRCDPCPHPPAQAAAKVCLSRAKNR